MYASDKQSKYTAVVIYKVILFAIVDNLLKMFSYIITLSVSGLSSTYKYKCYLQSMRNPLILAEMHRNLPPLGPTHG